MILADLTLNTPQENLACDEALLDACEESGGQEILRFWESPAHFVVLGSSSRLASDVDIRACRERGIPVLRRRSGGGTVVQGPGCLNVTLILTLTKTGPLSTITGTTEHVLRRHLKALQPLVPEPMEIRGRSDLTIGNLKFSGNAQRRRQRCLMFHGTILHNFDLPLIGVLLHLPLRQPEYREHRPHDAFLTNLHVLPGTLKSALRREWEATNPLTLDIAGRIALLVDERYSRDSWNLKY